MDTQQAVTMINTILYKPGWRFEASDHTNRFEGTVNVTITYPAFDSGSASIPEAWREGYSTRIAPDGARASFSIVVGDTDRVGVQRRLLNVIMDIEEHEAREFLRDPSSGEALFHPHRIEGMNRWGNVSHDLQFGLS